MENEKFDVFVDNSKYDWDDGNIVCQDIFLKIV